MSEFKRAQAGDLVKPLTYLVRLEIVEYNAADDEVVGYVGEPVELGEYETLAEARFWYEHRP